MTYSIYTTEYDVTLRADKLPKPDMLEALQHKLRIRKYENRTKQVIEKAHNRAVAFKASQPQSTIDHWAQKAVSILVDHSGSLKRDDGAEMALCAVEAQSAFLGKLGIPFEILGFTTRSWRGGHSRELWSYSGAPDQPGRLCDLLHIVYRDFTTTDEAPPALLKQILRHDLVKENIDGEALEWASDRLAAYPVANKALIHISDGAPVDDSTITENPETFLVDHLLNVIKKLETIENFKLYGFGIGYEVGEYFSNQKHVETLLETADVAISQLEKDILA